LEKLCKGADSGGYNFSEPMISNDPHERRFAAWLDAHSAIPRQLSRASAPESPESADEADLHQEMLVQLWRSVSRFRGEAKPSPWIYRVYLNTGLTGRRTEGRRLARVVRQFDSIETASVVEVGPTDAQENQDLMTQLMQAGCELPPGDRALVVRYRGGKNYRARR
jgi:RNA polymerase sigma factor (sigma-70 family)